MTDDFDAGVSDDARALREIFAALDRLEAAFDAARAGMSARQRGYFTPDEDDRVRQMQLAYRNLRLALYEIVGRYRGFRGVADQRARLRGFVTGYAAALRLYRKSLKLIETAEMDAFLRAKLNEPDARFGLDTGFFDQVLSGLSSLANYSAIGRAGRYWAAHRRTALKLGLDADPELGWLIAGIAADRRCAQNLFWRNTLRRFRRDARLAWRVLFAPLDAARYGSQSLVGALLSQLRVPRHRHALDAEVLDRLRPQLRPGDILLVRADDKVTCALLPGFWAHAAIYLGGADDLRRLALPAGPALERALAMLERAPQAHGYVLEAIPHGVELTPLAICLRADHVAVLRPGLAAGELTAALADALGHLGKPYDFEFDFNVSTRIVCTELVYRAFHGRGGISFRLIKRLGRWTLSADDLAVQARSLATQAGSPQLEVVALWQAGADGRATSRRGGFAALPPPGEGAVAPATV